LPQTFHLLTSIHVSAPDLLTSLPQTFHLLTSIHV
jgi:hypothetical protein